MVGLYPLDLGQSTKETQRVLLETGRMIADLVWMITILSWWIRVVPPLHRQFLSLQWFALMLTPHCVIPTQLVTRLFTFPHSPMIPSDMATTSPFCIKGSMRMLTAEGQVWKERASGNTVPWEFLLGQSCRYQNVPQRFLHFLMEVRITPFSPPSTSPEEVKLRPKLCPPCDSSSHPPFHPHTPGVELTPVQ